MKPGPDTGSLSSALLLRKSTIINRQSSINDLPCRVRFARSPSKLDSFAKMLGS